MGVTDRDVAPRTVEASAALGEIEKLRELLRAGAASAPGAEAGADYFDGLRRRIDDAPNEG